LRGHLRGLLVVGIGLSLATTRLVGDKRRSAVGWIASGAALGAALGGVLIAVGGYALFGFVIGLTCFVVIGMVILATRPYPSLLVSNTEALADE
jgi:hypothetical protein